MWLILFIGISWHRNGQRRLNTPWNPAVDQVCTVEQDCWSSCLTWWQQGMTYLSIMVSPSTSSPLSPNTAAIVVEHCTCEKMPSHKSSLQTCSQSEPCWPAMSEACLAHAVFKTPCCLGPEGGVILLAFVAVQLVFMVFPAVLHLLVDTGLSDWRCLGLLQSCCFLFWWCSIFLSISHQSFGILNLMVMKWCTSQTHCHICNF